MGLFGYFSAFAIGLDWVVSSWFVDREKIFIMAVSSGPVSLIKQLVLGDAAAILWAERQLQTVCEGCVIARLLLKLARFSKSQVFLAQIVTENGLLSF